MLNTLHVRDFVIVDQAEISFDSGFTALTGETGAGKSLLIDALSLALGARADALLVREGAPRAEITALFEPDDTTRQWLSEQALDASELILRRVIDRQGRSRAYINGTPATLGQLRELGALLVDIHGQHAHQSLLRTATHREMLDAQGQHTALAQAVAAAWAEWQAALQALQRAQADASRQAERIATLQADLERLDEVAPQAGEWPELCARQARLAHAQTLLSSVAHAVEALDGAQGSATQALGEALQALRAQERHDATLQAPCEALESARILCQETVSDLNSYADRLELDPQALEVADARMGVLFDAARRFHVEPEALAEHHEAVREALQRATEGQDLDALQARCTACEATYDDCAKRLSEARAQAAPKLAAQVTQAMQALSMEGGSLAIALTPCAPSSHGREQVSFLVAGHAGTTPRELTRVASGGELARIALALSVIASEAARVPTLIFDEVDVGIGGAVAQVVGQHLRTLGTRHQVLCVTHLPQVAACANHQLSVRKASSAGQTRARVHPLDDAARIDEIARMLGGVKITATTRRHAQEMLQTMAR